LYIDRKVEILNSIELNIAEWIDILDSEEGELEKSVILKIIADQEEITKEEYSDKIIKYIYDEKEVKIAAISALSKSKNEKYIHTLFELYQKDEMWEVRAAVAKGISHYKLNAIKEMLLEMVRDKEWWVRFNAARTISLMGEEGIYILIDLSVDKSDENASALAYYFLNSNKDIYETINRLEV
jgi:HEAT repeat protein